MKDLCTRKREKLHNSDNVPLISRTLIVNLGMVLHNTLTFHQWLKKEFYGKMDFVEDRRKGQSKASLHIKNYLEMFKQVARRGSNRLKTRKFHQMLHVCDHIKQHDSPLNYDRSRGENFGKIKTRTMPK